MKRARRIFIFDHFGTLQQYYISLGVTAIAATYTKSIPTNEPIGIGTVEAKTYNPKIV